MNKNILIAATASLLFHSSICLYSLLQTRVPTLVAKPGDPPIVFTLPPIPPEPVEPDPLQGDPGKSQPDYSPTPPSLPPTPGPTSALVTSLPPLSPTGPIADTPTLPKISYPSGPGGDGNGPRIFPLSDLTHQPEATVQFPPQYPYEMKRNGIQGTVMVSFIVDAHGGVHNAVAEDSPYPEFSSAAAAAVSKWQFRPGTKDGIAVATRMAVPIVFSLQSNP